MSKPLILELKEKVQRSIVTATSSEAIDPIGEFTKINLDNCNITGNKLTASNGGIKIGEGISKVLVSAQGTPVQRNSAINIAIYVNDEQKARSVTNGDVQATVLISNKLIDVKENDIVYLYYWSTAESFSPTLTWLTVEAIN